MKEIEIELRNLVDAMKEKFAHAAVKVGIECLKSRKIGVVD